MYLPSVLFVEDDQALSFATKYFLEQQGYNVTHCFDAETAWRKFMKYNYDIALFDIMLPGKNGLELARQVRAKNALIPILVMSAKNSDEERIEGMESGADCYIPKPYNLKEVHKRMQVFLRYRTKKTESIPEKYIIGDYVFDFAGYMLSLPDGSYQHELTPREAELLHYLYSNTGRVIKKEEILTELWGKNDQYLGRSLDVFINKIRKYFRSQPAVEIKTVHGIGYRFHINTAGEQERSARLQMPCL